MDRTRAQALTELAPQLPPDLLAQALSAATTIPDDDDRAGALTGLAPRLPPDLLAQALKATPKTSVETLSALLQASRSVLPRYEDAVYVYLLRVSFNGVDREACFNLIASAAEAVSEIGGMSAIEQCVHAVMDVHRWWP